MELLTREKSLTAEIKADSEERTLTAIASTSNPDRDHDVLPSDGWNLKNFKKNPVMLYGHDSRALPIATVTDIKQDGEKLVFKARFPKPGIHDFADKVYELYKDGILKAFSVRFSSKDYEKNDYGGLTFKKSELLEISAVTIPANAEALVQQVKQLKESDNDMADTKAPEKKEEKVLTMEEVEAKIKEMTENMEKNATEKANALFEDTKKEYEETIKEQRKALEELNKRLNELKEAEKARAEAEKIAKEQEKKEIGAMKKAPAVIEKHTDETRVKDYFMAMLNKDYAGLKDLSEGTDKYGGYLVPNEFRNQILQIMGDGGVARREGTVINMSGDTLNIPRLDTKTAVSWTAESGTISSGTPEFGTVTLTAKKAALIVPVTSELFEDSAVNLQQILAGMFAEKIAEAEDTQAFTGDGTVFTGILNESDINTVTMGSGDTGFANVALDDLFNLIAAVKQSVARNGKFFMHRTIWSTVKNMTDTNGNYVFNPTDQTLLGYPVVFSDDMNSISDSAISTVFMGFGDLRNIYIGDRRRIAVALADQATVGSTNTFEEDMLAMRVTERIGMAIALPQAFAVLKTASA
jgi:HK97 family phage major capsid protein/HK97 family phage prohead protease